MINLWQFPLVEETDGNTTQHNNENTRFAVSHRKQSAATAAAAVKKPTQTPTHKCENYRCCWQRMGWVRRPGIKTLREHEHRMYLGKGGEGYWCIVLFFKKRHEFFFSMFIWHILFLILRISSLKDFFLACLDLFSMCVYFSSRFEFILLEHKSAQGKILLIFFCYSLFFSFFLQCDVCTFLHILSILW